MMDNFKKSVVSGDYSKIYGDSGYALAIYNQDNRLDVGDKIKIGDEEIEIACVAPEAAVSKIYNLADGNLISDNREENSVVNGSYWVFRLAAYGFLTIISLITVRNIMNSISMGVPARIKQYEAMRAVGMESRQVTKMITAEAATYAFCGMIVGTLIGLWLHYLIYVKIIITHFGGSWNIPVTTIGIIFLQIEALFG